VAAVERAVSAAEHVIVDMADFPAADQPAAQVCAERVQRCDVYVGVLGTRYGSPVRDMPAKSYTELEFDTATEAAKDRLVFLLDTGAADLGIPASALIDREFGARQDAFRDRVRASGLVTQSFDSPAELGRLVAQSLRELADTRRRIDSGIVREQVPAEPQPVRESKFVNPPPAVAPAWFQDRQIETGLLAKYVTDPAIAMVMVAGRGGIGKTAMVCRLLKDLESGRIPDVEGNYAKVAMGGIVYLSSKGVHQVDYPTLVADLPHLLSAEEARRLQLMYQDPHRTPREMMLAVLEAFPAGDPVVVLLDNLESVMDTETEALAAPALGEALTAVMTAPAHAVTVIATTRVLPTALLKTEPAHQRQLLLEEGLGSPDAQIVLRELDDDGRLGLRDADDGLLDGLRAHTRGFPRALEAVKAILDGDPTLTPRDLLDRTRDLPEDQVVQVLVGEAYDLLDHAGKQVMQALAVFPAPVSAVGVDFLLRPVNPTTDAAPILTRLVRRQLVRFHDGNYHLHPVDRDYARSQLAAGSPGDAPAAFTLTGLQTRAADYYARIRTPRESWRTLEDVRPQLDEFGLRCDSGDYDTAATVLQDIDFDYLRVWGHYRALVGLHERIHGKITDPALNVTHLTDLGLCHFSLSEYRQAIDLFIQALDIARDISDRGREGVVLGNLGLCYYLLDEYRRAIDLHTQALDIHRDIGNRQAEGATLGNLGLCYYLLGEYRRAIDLHTQALHIHRDIGDRQGESIVLGNLGNCYISLSEYRRAIDLYTQAREIARDISYRQGEGLQLGGLGNCYAGLGEYRRAIDLYTQALDIFRDIGDRQSEGNQLGGLGDCYAGLGEYRRAIDLYTQAREIARDISDRQGEGNQLGGLGNCYLSLGEYRRSIDLYTQALDIFRDVGDRQGEGNQLGGLGDCYLSLGEYRRAIDLYTQALDIFRDVGVRQGEGLLLGGLGDCYLSLGEYRRAIDLYTQALDIDRDIDYRHGEAIALAHLGQAWLGSGDAQQAVTVLGQAMDVADATGGIEPAAEARSWLARAQLQLGDPAAALAAAAGGRELPYPVGEPALRLLEGVALLALDRADESVRSFSDALAAADALLALAASNVAALQARALALSGLAVAAGDPARAAEAVEAFGRADAVTSATGVAADSRRLLDVIAAHDRTRVLAELRASQDQ
jgi:tetratricopeptide (TPR) repeat protein